MSAVLDWCRRSKDLERALKEHPDLAKDYEERKKKYRVGFFGCWSPEFLQVFRNPVYFTAVMFAFALLEGILVNGLLPVVLSSIERRYGFTSTMTGLIASTFDITVILCIVPISYFGGRGHKPVCLGVCAIIHGIGGVVFSLPHFVGGAYMPRLQGQGSSFCEAELNVSSLPYSCVDSPSWVYFIFILGIVLMGIGAAPLFTIGTSFLDDIAWPKKSSVYLGVYYVASVLGPAAGFGLGGAFLSLFVEPLTDPASQLGLQPTDPAFVGAWWLGFLLIGVLVVALAAPILAFPREVPQGELIRRERSKDMVLHFSGSSKDPGLKGDLKEAPRHFLQVFSSPTWLFFTLALAFQAVSISGGVTFGPKYFEVQYRYSASLASFISGGIGIAGAAVGIIIGTVIIFCLKSTGTRAALIVFLSSLLSTLVSAGFIFSCPNALVPGPQNNGSVGFLLTGAPAGNLSCSGHCGCTTNVYTPVCDVVSGLTYFSPCHAGCPNNTQGDVYSNCSCASMATDSSVYSPMTGGKCGRQCTVLAGAIVLLVAFLTFAFAGEIPGLFVVMRIVAEEQRSLALGVQSMLYRIIGEVPGPLIFGAIFDSTCVLWRYECGERGNCWEYSNHRLSLGLFLALLLSNVANTAFALLGLIWYGRDWCFRKVPDKEEQKKKAACQVGSEVSAPWMFVNNPTSSFDSDDKTPGGGGDRSSSPGTAGDGGGRETSAVQVDFFDTGTSYPSPDNDDEVQTAAS